MTYTFWHAGVLIGKSDLERASGNPRQHGGVFHPTAYGLEVFPRLSGILSAGHALKADLEAAGAEPDHMSPDEIGDYLETSDPGRRILEIGRMLSEVEMRGPDGRRVEFASIAFSDLLELSRVARSLQLDGATNLEHLPPEAPRYIVSATFRSDPRAASRGSPVAHRLRGYWRES